MRLPAVLLVLGCALLCAAGRVAAEGDGAGLRREIALGFNRSSGNSDTDEVLARLDIARKSDDSLFEFWAECFNSSDSGRTSAERASGFIRYAYRFSDSGRWRHSVKTSADHDRFANIDVRALAASGVEYLVLKHERHEAGCELSAGYEYTDYCVPADDDEGRPVIMPRLFAWAESAGGTRISQSVIFFAYPDGGEGWRMESRTMLQAPLGSGMALRLSLDDFYNSEPGAGIEENDLRLVSSLACSF